MTRIQLDRALQVLARAVNQVSIRGPAVLVEQEYAQLIASRGVVRVIGDPGLENLGRVGVFAQRQAVVIVARKRY
jgi:hypothetical protein